jgi:ABC-type amino acid transport substrate-binding protein
MLQIKRSRSYQISGRVLILPMLQIKRSRSYQISGRGFRGATSFAFTKDSPFTDAINEVLKELLMSGTMSKI